MRHPDAHRLDMRSFGHEDLEMLPAILDVIKGLGKEMEWCKLSKRSSCGGVMKVLVLPLDVVKKG